MLAIDHAFAEPCHLKRGKAEDRDVLGFTRNCEPIARKAYQLFRENARHPSLQFKKVHDRDPIYAARVTLGYRALGLLENDEIAWFWMGTHAAYDRLLEEL